MTELPAPPRAIVPDASGVPVAAVPCGDPDQSVELPVGELAYCVELPCANAMAGSSARSAAMRKRLMACSLRLRECAWALELAYSLECLSVWEVQALELESRVWHRVASNR